MILKRISKPEVAKVEVVFDSDVQIYGLTEEQKDRIKKDLTFKNPLYATTQRYSRYSYTTVPPYLTYYEDRGSYIRVPVGYNIDWIPSKHISDSRVFNKIEHSPFIMTLRDSQQEAAEAFLSYRSHSSPVGCVQMPTGKGKTILGLYLASVLSVKTLVVVHKDDLVRGWQKDIKEAFADKVHPGLIKAKSRRVGNFITIATIQTLNKLSSEELSSLFSEFGFVIQDEMHHCPASSFSLVRNFRARYKLGLTATPERTDGLAHVMNLYFGDFCYRFEYTAEDKDILPVKVMIKNNPLFFNPLCEKKNMNGKTRYVLTKFNYSPDGKPLEDNQILLSDIPYDFRPKVSFQQVDSYVVDGIKEQVCSDIISEYDRGHSCLVFFTQKEDCRKYFEELKQSVSESHIGIYYGDNKDNDKVLESAEKIRKFITLTTYAKATEGTNVKQWEVLFLVSSINNEKNTEQAVGRIRRTMKGEKINPVLVYDYRTPKVYSFASHGRTRDSRYRALHFEIEGVPKRSSLFSRGFKT